MTPGSRVNDRGGRAGSRLTANQARLLLDLLVRPWYELAASDDWRDFASPLVLVLVTSREQYGQGFERHLDRWTVGLASPVLGPLPLPDLHPEDPDFGMIVLPAASEDATAALLEELGTTCPGEGLVAVHGLAGDLTEVQGVHERMEGACTVARRAERRLGSVMHLDRLLPFHAALALSFAERRALVRTKARGLYLRRGQLRFDQLLDTLWADAANTTLDLAGAARELHVHKNTLAYRNRVLNEATGLDLDRDSFTARMLLCVLDLSDDDPDLLPSPDDPWWDSGR